MTSLQVQLGAIDDGLLTTDRSIQKLEHLIVQLGGTNGAERLLIHFAGMRRRLEAVRTCLVSEITQAPENPQQNPHSPDFIG